MPFFDFHLHPTLKSLFSEQTDTTQKFSPWERLRKETIPLALRWCTEFEYIIQSQSNLRQLLINDCNLAGIALYIPERRFIDNSLVSQGAQSSLKTYLQPQKIQKLIQCNPYEQLMEDDWVTLTNAQQFGVTDLKVKPITKVADYNEADGSTLHVVFTVEGCHVLMDQLGVYNKQTINTGGVETGAGLFGKILHRFALEDHGISSVTVTFIIQNIIRYLLNTDAGETHMCCNYGLQVGSQ